MTAPLWEAGHLYLPGDIVQPIKAAAAAPTAITNPDFDSDATGWTLPAGATVAATGGYSTPKRLEFTGTAGNLRLVNTAVAVTPGVSITASAVYQQGAASSGKNPGRVVLVWYTAAMAEITASESLGNIISSGSNSAWAQSSVTGTAPGTAAFVAIGFRTTRDDAATSYVDRFAWNLVAAAVPAGLIYKAVQAAAGTSGSSEPAWPATLGLTVVDNQVTWEAVNTSRVTWKASPVLLSGATEPVWPGEPGELVVDGTVSWEAVSRHVADAKCPHSKFVKIIGNKVYAGDGDIIRYSATANPLDWSTANDAGYLPYGLNPHGASPVAALGEYRSNLVAFNAGGLQMWQVDEDPDNAALLDAMPIGSTWHRALFSVGDDLFFLTQKGVRTVGITGASASLASGQDVGDPIDPLVLDSIRVAEANSSRVVSTYAPAESQYLLAFADYPPAALALTGDLPGGATGVAVSYTYIATGGVKPYAFSILSGALPAGLTMSSAGVVTGTRTTAATATWTVRVTDADGATADLADSSATVAGFYWDTVNNVTLSPGTGGVAEITLSATKLRAAMGTAGSATARARSTVEVTGLRYVEVDWTRANAVGGAFWAFGVTPLYDNVEQVLPNFTAIELGANQLYVGGVYTADLTAPTFTGGVTRAGMAVNDTLGKVWFRTNANGGAWIGGGDPALGTGGYAITATATLPTVIRGECACNALTQDRALTIINDPALWTWAAPAGFS